MAFRNTESKEIKSETDSKEVKAAPDKIKAGKIILDALKKHTRKKRQVLRNIKWVTGTSGKTLAALRYTGYELVPTGMLLEQKIAPMAGELGNGITLNGVNQTCLSGVAPENFSTAWGYATDDMGKPLDLLELENSIFSKMFACMNKILNRESKDYIEEKTLIYLTIYILQARQLNESRYQECIKNIDIKELVSIISDGSQFRLVTERARVRAALSVEIPEEVDPKKDVSGKNMINFLKRMDCYYDEKGYSGIVKYRGHSYMSVISELESIIRECDYQYKGIAEGFLNNMKYDADLYAMLYRKGNDFYGIILFLRAVCNTKIKELEDRITQYIDKFYNELRTARKRLLAAINEGPLYHYSDSVKKEMLHLQTFPVVFATTTTPNDLVKSTYPGEVLHQGKLKIDLIITDKRHYHQLTRHLIQKGLFRFAGRVCTEEQLTSASRDSFNPCRIL